jgi:hypothetical protein
MATFTKFNAFPENLCEAVHNFEPSAHSIKAMLTNTAPSASNSVKADLTEISAGNGYTAGGNAITVSSSAQTSGTQKVVMADTTWTASGGSIGPFRYVVLYNDTPTSPADPLICYWDYGSSITLSSGSSFTTDFDASAGVFTLA